MRGRRAAVLILVLSLAALASAAAQDARPGPAAALARFESWRVELPSAPLSAPAAPLFAAEKNRTRRALIGGGIGAAAGLLGCTVISTLADDSADGGLSFCPLDSYLLIGGAGFLVGAAIGWLS